MKEVVPEGLLLRALGTVARVRAHEVDGAGADFVPGKMGHGLLLAKAECVCERYRFSSARGNIIDCNGDGGG